MKIFTKATRLYCRHESLLKLPAGELTLIYRFGGIKEINSLFELY
jgi:hypothetical protein